MWSEGMLPLLLALAGIGGGAITKILDYFTDSGRGRQDELAEVRQELLGEVRTLRARVDALTLEVDKWQSMYFDLRVELEVQRRENQLLQLQRLKPTPTNAGPDEGPAVLSGGAA